MLATLCYRGTGEISCARTFGRYRRLPNPTNPTDPTPKTESAGSCPGQNPSRDELPPDPEARTEAGPNGPRSVWGAIHYPPSPPVLADGLFLHIAPFDKEQETDVEIPNINCAKCTLQVIEFMAAHNRNRDGDFTYHHCAELQIRANPNKPVDVRFPAEKK
jgi:hypothetical protein